MHVIEAAGFAIVQDDAALIERRAPSRLWRALYVPARVVVTLAAYIFFVFIALLIAVRSRGAHPSSVRAGRRAR